MKTLIIDPNDQSRDALRRAFQAVGAQARGVASLPEGQRQLAELLPDVVVASLDASGEALSFLLSALAEDSNRSALALVDADRLEDGVEAMTRGVRDVLWRPVSEARVGILLGRISHAREREGRAERQRLELASREMAASLAGSSPAWKETLASILRQAATECAVLLTGEPGTEKESAARSLHRLSRRGSEPFLRAATDEDLTNAVVGGGSLFVPAIERIDCSVQERLLSRLENPKTPRLIVASDEEPRAAIAAGRLLPALFESLKGHVVHLPPLRERGADVDLLARNLLAQIDPALFFDAEARDALSAHDWPGNVAELEQVVRRASRLSDRSAIGSTVVLSVLGGPAATRRARRRKPPVVRVPVGASLADVERRLIQKTLEFVRGNKPKAAELLKLSLKTIYNKIKEYGLEH